MKNIQSYVNQHKDRFLNELIELLKIPSISADSSFRNDVLKTAKAVKNSLENACIAIDRSHYNELSDTRKKAFDNMINVIKESGAKIIEGLDIKQTHYIFYLMKYEFKRNINHYLQSLGGNTKVKTLKDI